MKPPPMGRAITPDQKAETIERILHVWFRFPEMRLGQLLVNANFYLNRSSDLFSIEDEALAEKCEQFDKDFGP